MPVHQEASVETIHYGGHTQWYKVAMCQIPQFSANNQSKSISDLENPSVSFKFIMSHHVSSSSPIFLGADLHRRGAQQQRRGRLPRVAQTARGDHRDLHGVHDLRQQRLGRWQQNGMMG